MTAGRHESPRWGAWQGSLRLTRLHLRTHRWSVLGWPAVIVALSASTAAGIVSLYATTAARQGYAATIGTSTMSIAFNGRGYDLDTLGGITVNELGVYALLVYPAIAVHLAVRHTRGEEEAGREELLTAARVGRLAPLTAGALVTGLVLVAAGLLSGVSMAAAGLPLGGSMRYATALTLAMLTYAGAGLVAAQLSQSSRVANAVAVGVLGAAYLARAVADGRGSPLVWPNPTGWLAEAAPFGAARSWPLVGYG
ncbi:MAG TPA: hypothetical protein VHM65_02025, partial [Candidatus Lustribacter sp.]|nr:hypothetical protein [Candidatus Lustribacter sp.]